MFSSHSTAFPLLFPLQRGSGAGAARGVVLSLPEPSLLLEESSPAKFVTTAGSGHGGEQLVKLSLHMFAKHLAQQGSDCVTTVPIINIANNESRKELLLGAAWERQNRLFPGAGRLGWEILCVHSEVFRTGCFWSKWGYMEACVHPGFGRKSPH